MNVGDIFSCPTKFDSEKRKALYYVHHRNGTSTDTWIDIVNRAINQIILKYSKLNIEERTTAKVLVLIGEVWSTVEKKLHKNQVRFTANL